MAGRAQVEKARGEAGGDPSGRRLTAGERRQQLFTVALHLFAERGYRSTTMEEVAGAAGVTKPLLYQHFSSKRALYLELVGSVTEDLLVAIRTATAQAAGPRQQVELGFAAYFRMVVGHEEAFRLLYGRSDAGDPELGHALRRVEHAIVTVVDPLISAGLDTEHRRLLAYAIVGMAEGASRHWIAARTAQATAGGAGHGSNDGTGNGCGTDDGHGTGGGHGTGEADEAALLGRRLADLAWAGLRSVHPD